jgi:hypothetical protein
MKVGVDGVAGRTLVMVDVITFDITAVFRI